MFMPWMEQELVCLREEFCVIARREGANISARPGPAVWSQSENGEQMACPLRCWNRA
jgi:hypothetical protein